MILDILEQAKTAGVRLYLKDGKLKAAVKNGQLPSQLKDVIGLHKQELITYLAQGNDPYHCEAGGSGGTPLSHSQKRIWFEQKLAIDQPHYNMQAHEHFSGELDQHAFSRTIEAILERHQVLRSTYHEVNGEPEQLVQRQYRTPVTYSDLSALDDGSKMVKMNDRVRQSGQKVFDLERDLMLRVDVITLSQQDHLVVYTMHHIASDAWSVEILRKEVRQLYEGYRQGQEVELPLLPIQYRDFAKWQNKRLTGEALANHLRYWSRVLDGAPRCHSLPLDQSRPSQPSHVGCVVNRSLGSDVVRDVERVCKQHQTTSFVLLQTVFALLVGRHSGQNDIVMGVPISGRLRTELEPLIGFFVNTLPMRVSWQPDATFSELLKQNKRQFSEAFDHQEVPLDLLVKNICPQRDTGQHPLFQIAFQVLKGGAAAEPKEAEVEQIKRASENKAPAQQKVSIKVDLELHVAHGAKGINCHWIYNEALFSEQRIQRMADNYLRLLQSVLQGLNLSHEPRLGQLEAISQAEQERLLYLWNDNDKRFPDTMQIQQLFEQQAALTPDSIAIECGADTLTYGQLNAKANQLAAWLRSKGVKPDKIVGLSHPRSWQMVVSMLAVLKAGGAYLPIDPTYPEERIQHMIEDSGIELLLTQKTLLPAFEVADVTLLVVDHETTTQSIEEQSTDNLELPHEASADHLVYVIYTSGSTGRPKGVMIEHAGFVNYCVEEIDYLALESGSRLLHVLPSGFDAGNGLLFSALIGGATVVFEEPHNALSEFMQAQQITHAVLTPSLLSVQPQLALPKLKVIATGAEAISGKVLEFWMRGRKFWNLYGPTEATVASLRQEMTSQHAGNVIGRPFSNVNCYVLDESLQPVPQGAIGELHIAGVGVARGYLNRPELNAEKFIQTPSGILPQQRMYKTGDLVRYQDDGTLVFIGRADQQVKIRGFRVELEEIERVLLTHPLVNEAVVCVQEQRISAYIVATMDGFEQSQMMKDLRLWASQSLPTFMLPDNLYLLDKLPLTHNGKIDKKALPNDTKARELSRIAPRNELELRLQSLWQEVLGLESICISDDFFELGGHSLLAMKLINKVNGALAENLSLRCLFESSSVEKLARRIKDSRQTEHECLVSFSNDTSSPTIFCALGLGMFAMSVKGLADKLAPSYRLCVFEPPGMTSAQMPLDDLDALLNLYMGTLLAHQPEGPVYLLGHSFGGSLVYELAKRLEQLGRETHLILIDCFFSIFEEDLGGFCSKKLFKSVYSQMNSSSSAVDDSVAASQHLNKFRSVVDSQYHMLKAYMPETKLKGTTAVFFASQGAMSDPSKFEKVQDTYKALNDGQLDFIQVEGDHLSIFADDNSTSLARHIVETYTVSNTAAAI